MSKQTTKTTSSRNIKAGGYSVVATLVVIAIAIVLNLMVERVPAQYTKLDMTSARLFEITDQTKKVLASLKDEVTIYYITQPAQEEAYVRQLVNLYEGMSSKITVRNIDPIVYPNFGAQYTTETVYNNSLVVECNGRTKFVGMLDLFLYEMDYTTGEYTEDWNGEGALTAAIDYVTSDNLPVVYTLKGHGERELPETVTKLIDKQNMMVSELQLLTNSEVPEDADTLIINGPTNDISTGEQEIIRAFLSKGGKLMLLTDYQELELPNLAALMADYGVSLVPGIVIEGSMDNCLRGISYYLLPYLRYHDVTAPLVDGNYRTLLTIAQGIEISDSLREGLNVTPLLVSSGEAFSKLAGYNMTTYEKEEGDIDGPFYLGVAIEETAGADTTRIVWLPCATMLEDDVNQSVAGSNHDLFINAMGWLNARENSISIHSKRLETAKLVVPSSAQTSLSIIFIGGIPLLFLALGIIVSIRRRRV